MLLVVICSIIILLYVIYYAIQIRDAGINADNYREHLPAIFIRVLGVFVMIYMLTLLMEKV